MGTLLHLVGEDEFDLSDREIEESETDTEGEDSGLKHMRCFAHSQQIVVKKSLAKINNYAGIVSLSAYGLFGDHYSTLSLVVPSLLQLIQHLNDFKLNNSIVDYSWYISSFLDPLFKNEWLAISKWKIIAAREGNENNLENQIPCTSNDATKKSRPLSTISTDSEASLLKSPTKRRKSSPQSLKQRDN
ncbi:hypothetical protein BpHYR1_022696 [Brachionus plicatilis]|uniref:Zinc finger BED domain-containing 4-like n=1 Tax=Brachionus plicatilis TaxID=10195 RepID=A0A3M7RCX3_BRAPC|nr:hypothetical protein BpHYR1_022696 [Brachionus plicatilis]